MEKLRATALRELMGVPVPPPESPPSGIIYDPRLAEFLDAGRWTFWSLLKSLHEYGGDIRTSDPMDEWKVTSARQLYDELLNKYEGDENEMKKALYANERYADEMMRLDDLAYLQVEFDP